MREIKFRARSFTGVWVYGYYMQRLGSGDVIEHYICEADKGQIVTRVLGKTVGESTNLKDKNGKEIYDQDYFVAFGVKALIHYSVNNACWFWGNDKFDHATAGRGEIIGNIYENKELLK